MFTSVRHYEGIHPDDLDEVVRRVDEGFIPIIRAQAGFLAYYIFRTVEGELVSISVFESQAAAEGSNRAAANWIKENLAQIVPNAPQILVGEVAAYAFS